MRYRSYEMLPRSRTRKPGSANSTRRNQLPNPRHLVHRIQDGQRLRPGPHPPEFTQLPWFQLTVRLPNPVVVTTLEVARALARQLQNLSYPVASEPAESYSFRIHSVRVWGNLVAMNASASLSPLTVNFYNVNFATTGASAGVTLQNRLLESFTDYPDQVSRAAVGFEWPIAQQAISLGTPLLPVGIPIDSTLFSVAQGGGANCIAYIRLLWRPSTANVIVGSTDPVDIKETKGWSLLG
jgi:hypothetical protein